MWRHETIEVHYGKRGKTQLMRSFEGDNNSELEFDYPTVLTNLFG